MGERTRSSYDKDVIKSNLIVVCAHYLGPGRSQGVRAVWQCRGCGKRGKFSAYPKKNAAGCMNAACAVPEKMDSIGVIAYFEDLEPRGTGFIAILKRGYEILGIPDPESERPRKGSSEKTTPRAKEAAHPSRTDPAGTAGSVREPTGAPASGEEAQPGEIEPVPKLGRKAAQPSRPGARPALSGATQGASEDRRALPRPPRTSGWQAGEEPEDRSYETGDAAEGTSAGPSGNGPKRERGARGGASSAGSRRGPSGASSQEDGHVFDDEVFEGEIVDDADFASGDPAAARDNRAAYRRRTRAYAEGTLGYRRPAEAWVGEKGRPLDGPELLDAVYKEILYHCPLVPPHKAYLKGRGLSYDNMTAARLGSMTKERAKKVKDLLVGAFGKETLLSVPGFSKSPIAGRLSFTLSFECVLIPYFDDDGRVVTVEGRCIGDPPKGLGKYVSLRDAGSHLYVHPAYATEALEAFCEGVMGALVAAQEGIAVGSIQGFRRYKNPEDDGPLPELLRTNYTGSKIAYIPDVDDPPQPEILDTAPDTAFHLITRQGGEATIAFLPNGKDLDEWLLSMRASKRRARFTDLVARAVSPEEFAAGRAEDGPHDGRRREKRGPADASRSSLPVVRKKAGGQLMKPSAGGAAEDRIGRRAQAREAAIPPRGLFVAREIQTALLVLVAVLAVLAASWFAFARVVTDALPEFVPDLGVERAVADHWPYAVFAAFVFSGIVALFAWNAKRARRVVKARHLSGELKT